METRFCPGCESSNPIKTVKRKEKLRVRDADVVVETTVSVCAKCGETFATEAQEERNVERAYAEYRRREGLLSPSDIQQVRAIYGLSQLNFSRWLGWGDVTLHRYENGALPDAVHNETLMLLKDPRNAKKLLDLAAKNLPEPALGELRQRVDGLLKKDSAHLMREDLATSLSSVEPSDLNGFRRFDIDRFENMVLYVLKNAGPCFKTGLNKFLWYIDFGCYREQARSITGSMYFRFQHGPIPRSYDFLFAGMFEKGLLSVEEIPYRGTVGERYSSTVAPNSGIFTAEELDIANRWIARLEGKTSKELSDLAHAEKGYRDTEEREPIPYKFAMEFKLQPKASGRKRK